MAFIRDENKIQDRLTSDYKLLVSKGYNVLGVFLQGSQNYNMDYEGSDIDTKAIVIPSFEDFVYGRDPASTTTILKSNEHVDIKDIRLMFSCFKKQNINFLEILFTKYMLINEEYAELFQPMLDNRERIAHYNNYACVNCLVGMVLEKHKAMEHPYPTLIDKIEAYGYDPKQLHHIVRCTQFLQNYINGYSYADLLNPSNAQYLIEVKQCPPKYSIEEARELANKCVNEVKQLKEDYFTTTPAKIDSIAEEVISKVMYNILKYSFKKEVEK